LKILNLYRYNNFGVDLKTVRDDSRREKIAAVVHKLPHVIDCPGMGDDDSPELREILELLVGGTYTFIYINNVLYSFLSKHLTKISYHCVFFHNFPFAMK
jgi:hypothetical protein